MKKQKLRKITMIISLLLFPVTLYYFSPVLIINAALSGIINGSFIVFMMMLLFSIPFGRLFCAYFCPAGGLQECVYPINDKIPKQGWRNYVKYVIWFVWILLVVICYFFKGEIIGIDIFFETEHGISVSNMQSYIIYYGIIMLIFISAVLHGKRVFCHYFCWMAPFMVLGTKIRRFFHLPGLHIKVNYGNACISCGKCNKVCPMGIEVSELINEGQINSMECIQCGNCIEGCPGKVLSYGMIERKKENGSRKED